MPVRAARAYAQFATHTVENQINYCQFCSRPLPPKKCVAYFREQQQQRKNHCIKNAPIKLSPGYNCASSEYFMAPPTSLLPLLLSFIVYGCAGEPHGKRFCAFSCLVYTPRAHEYAMVSAPATPPRHTLWLVQQSQS